MCVSILLATVLITKMYQTTFSNFNVILCSVPKKRFDTSMLCCFITTLNCNITYITFLSTLLILP